MKRMVNYIFLLVICLLPVMVDAKANVEFEKATKYAGLNESKTGFSTTLTEYIGEFDIVLNSFSYNLYNKMNNK